MSFTDIWSLKVAGICRNSAFTSSNDLASCKWRSEIKTIMVCSGNHVLKWQQNSWHEVKSCKVQQKAPWKLDAQIEAHRLQCRLQRRGKWLVLWLCSHHWLWRALHLQHYVNDSVFTWLTYLVNLSARIHDASDNLRQWGEKACPDLKSLVWFWGRFHSWSVGWSMYANRTRTYPRLLAS